MSELHGISDRSAGPAPDALALKLGGATDLTTDLARGTEVEVTVRGLIVGHAFDDKRGKDGEVALTVKSAKFKADELVEVKAIPSRNVPSGQMTVEEALRDIPGVDSVTVTRQRPAAVDEDGVIAEVPSPIDPGAEDRGDEQDDPGEEERSPVAPVRHPSVPEEAWTQLNHEQQRDVLTRVARVERLTEYLAGANTPTDREQAEGLIGQVTGALQDDFNIELIPFEDVVEEDERVAPATEPPPAPVTVTSPPLARERLEKRRDYLLSKRALPAEMEQERQAELEEITRRLAALGTAA